MSARVLTAPAAKYLRPGDPLTNTDLYASPDAIRVHLKNAREQEQRWRRLGEQLTKILADRLSQIEAGEWPPAGTRSGAE